MDFPMKLRCVLSILLVICFKAKADIKLPPNVTIPAVLAFGDSIIDPGNNNNIVNTVIKSNFAPYGRDFPEGIPTGRFSNGKVPTDIIAEELGIKDLLPAYLDPSLKTSELATGVCFASGGAGYDPLTSHLTSVISLSAQLDLFKEYLGKLRGVVGEDRTNFILANSVFLLVLGSNDISNTYFLLHVRELQYDFPAYADIMVNLASAFLKEIYALGARRIGVLSAPPIGCLPFQRTAAGGITRECVEDYNDASMLFNNKLSNEINSLNQNFTDSIIGYIDIYNPLLHIIQNGKKYGFNVVDRGCCGTGTAEVSFLCNPLLPMCHNDQEHVFWDSFHPTEALYKILVPPVLQKYINQI